MFRLNTRALLAIAGLAAMTASVLAHGGATGIVGERMMGMMMLSEQVKLLTPVRGGGGSADPVAVSEAASMIEMHGGPAMTKLFPADSIEGPSVARPEIWQRWQEFSDYADRLSQLAAELRLAATAPEARVTAAEQALPATLEGEWGKLDVAALLGIADDPETIDKMVTGSIENTFIRKPTTIFADITATCSSCHASFRR
ncbi:MULTISPECIES: cytochrome c [unclassified Devosia]|uniref:cytochrome c n=1 Tax=unclassified Devosia TaxID=196773 RepID=UPI00086B0BEE|nr:MULTISPECIES: cytochrome c [unclassified Devosia]MBN9360748.1 cytochrome c [Devosia sp.]ODS87936.1 MAG: hypothetical protein ABS47_11175 [Devosia sp. SCN 66-27]OJX22711.1 MAG: hypothetical protein BGO83_18155 [Devosia sp. 66-14]